MTQQEKGKRVSQLIAKGAPMKIVATVYQSNPNAVMALKKTGIKSVADLKGKKVGVPFVSTSHFHLLYAMELAGLRRNDVQVLNMRPPEIAAAWGRGDIDATFIWDPVLSTVKKNGKAKKILVFKYKAKVRYRRKNGHRQPFTSLNIDKILGPGEEDVKPVKRTRKKKTEEQADGA